MPADVSPLFRLMETWGPLAVDEKRALAEAFDPPQVRPADSELVHRGSYVRHSTLLIDGLTIRYDLSADGERQITAIYVPGDFVDLHAYALKPVDNYVATLTDATIATILHERLTQVMERYPRLVRRLWHLTLRDAAIHRKWLAMMSVKAPPRTAHLFCELATRLSLGELAAAGEFPLPVTQQELSDALGMSIVHTNRTIRDLRERRLLQWDGRRVRILDWAGLCDLAQFDPAYLLAGPD